LQGGEGEGGGSRPIRCVADLPRQEDERINGKDLAVDINLNNNMRRIQCPCLCTLILFSTIGFSLPFQKGWFIYRVYRFIYSGTQLTFYLLPSFPPSLLPSFPPSLLPSFPPSPNTVPLVVFHLTLGQLLGVHRDGTRGEERRSARSGRRD